MPETVEGGISRSRKKGRGEITLTPELIQQIQGLTPQWSELAPKKILDMVDRALPSLVSDQHLVTFSLPGGKQTVHIPIAIHNGNDSLLIIKPHGKKSIRIKDC